jgi:hypothetical protein
VKTAKELKAHFPENNLKSREKQVGFAGLIKGDAWLSALGSSAGAQKGSHGEGLGSGLTREPLLLSRSPSKISKKFFYFIIFFFLNKKREEDSMGFIHQNQNYPLQVIFASFPT